MRCVTARAQRQAIATRWLLPDKHGPLYYYQKLMLDVPWRDFLQAWGQLREEDILKRDDIGRYYIEGGVAEAIAAETKAE